MKRTAVLVAAILVLALAASAHADTYVGIYGGYTYIPDTDVDVTVGGSTLTIPDQEFDAGATVGGKAGYWLKTLPWLAGELNVWNTWTGPEDSSVDLTLVNFSGSVLLQWMNGPLRVYGGGGVVGTWAELSNSDSQDDFAVGALGQGGVEYEFIPAWTVFGEYRYTWNSFEFEEAGVTSEFDLSRHEFLGGVNFRF